MFEANGSTPGQTRKSRDHEVAFDDVDRLLLRELAVDGRIPNNQLAVRVGIAPSTCSLRLRRLRDLGAIRGFHADIDLSALGYPIQAMISVRVRPNARALIGDMAARLASLPGVGNVYFLAGSVDFVVHVSSSSPTDLREFVARHLSTSPDVASTETSLVLEHVRSSHTI